LIAHRLILHRVLVLAGLVLLTGCAVGPMHTRPDMGMPLTLKEAPPGSWKVAQPADAVPRGAWWKAFGDAELDALAERALKANQDLVLAAARMRQAQALVRQARAEFFPTVDAGLGVSRAGGGAQQNRRTYQLAADARWEADLWGRIGNTVAARQAGYQASAADAESARLSVLAELARNYFDLRIADAQQRLLADNVAAYARSLELTRNRQRAGVVDRSDVVQAEVQWKGAQAQLIDLGAQRAQLEHAIAVLIGELPGHFTLPPAPMAARLPVIPLGVASDLLERRPDIAAAERDVAAANAQIGVAQAAYFPSLTLSASGGFSAGRAAEWLTAPSRVWSLGAGLAQMLFDAGARQAQTEQARALHEQQIATYRQTVLQAFKEVEDGLSSLRILEEEARLQEETVAAARQALELVTNQYKAGIVGYLNVIAAQTTVASNERAAASLQGRRLAASVDLIRALGGGWESSALPAGTP
jgi:NodT family efflux transporter outer membrane factor (OMF) lipoprotein